MPCCCRNSLLLESLRAKKLKGGGDDSSSSAASSAHDVRGQYGYFDDMQIFLYPNLHGDAVFIREKGTNALRR